MKKSIAILSFAVILNSCSAASSANEYSITLPPVQTEEAFGFVIEEGKRQEAKRIKEQDLVTEIVTQQYLDMNKHLLIEQSEEIKKHVGTPYVYSGATPNGWDCSGLVVWYYEGLGITLPHSASAQTSVGIVVNEPQIGDIVIIRQPGRSNFHHSSIYVGDNKIIHAGWQRGDSTEIISLEDKYLSGSEIIFVRVMN